MFQLASVIHRGYFNQLLYEHDSMIKIIFLSCRTNLPDTVMYFTDFPVNEAFGKCVSHEKVREYLESYAEHFNLKRHIEASALHFFSHSQL